MLRNLVRRNEYYDSVFLMVLTRNLKGVKGLKKVSVVMGTPMNKSLLEEMGLLLDEGRAASANDLVVAVDAENPETLDLELERLLKERNVSLRGSCRSIDAALKELPDASLAMISLPGEFAAAEGRKALERGLNVYMFSDNVPIEDELELKRLAKNKGLLMMGPDCGLTYWRKTAIGLASQVKSGPIGLVGASGSGMQEVMAIIDRAGMGISQAIGVGGRDLRDEIGGITMLQSIDLLEEDPETEVIVIVSKPPGPRSANAIRERLAHCSKKTLVNFIGEGATFEDTAYQAMSLVKGSKLQAPAFERPAIKRTLGRGRRYLRGIFCGGTLEEEAQSVLKPIIGYVHSNEPLNPEFRLDDPLKSVGHCLIDIGAEEFTKGRPHAAIDPAPRVERFLQEAADPETAVILFDILLGYGMHGDPAGMMVEAMRKSSCEALVVASLCGTELDPQGYAEQRRKLVDAGVLFMPNNAQAARLAGELVKELDR